VGLPRSGSIAGLLVLPIAVPLLIFAAAFCADGGNQAMALEASISILLLAGAPFVTAAAIRAART
jgi:heme exporter protein B